MAQGLRIGVAGAGIGGLASAIALTLAGHSVTICDRFEAPRPLGSGLVIQPVGQRVLDWLGCGTALRRFGTPIRVLHGIEAPTGAGTLNVRYDAGGAGLHGIGIHRSALFHLLHERLLALGPSVRPASEVTGTEVDASGRWLRLADGTRLGPFDLLVDALGSHSPLSPLVSRPLPFGALWTTLDWPDTDLPNDRLSQRYVAARRMVGVLPIGHLPEDDTQRAAFFWSLKAEDLPRWQTEGLSPWKAEMTALWPQLAPFAAQITDPAQMTFARYSHGTLYRPIGDRLVHLGDAAHRASPQLGQGANMALLDALALARALDQTEAQDAPALYATMRRGHLAIYQAASRFLTPQYQSDSAAMAWFRDRVTAPLSRIPPMPWLLGRIASGLLVPPLAGEPHAEKQPCPPVWAIDGRETGC
ncbi:NAD(P)/FAD-dependent oxidoreductase [Pararhodobacter sp. CCB-MM2]|uniref:FAD-dependent oxidoreductase n=1 Tax=Pararhodobacter sp. CCB-MM2 TaxID=1786003 RepID=UPI000834D94A|nr:NAD(P)/FAD-dependent oxidoreductase [Pararhodobacter sp. CCB-MM2]